MTILRNGFGGATWMLAGFLAGISSGVSFAAEKIQFTDRPRETLIELPSKAVERSRAMDARPGRFRDEVPSAPAPAPAAQPNVDMKRLEQYLDQKKNWVFQTQEGRQSGIKDILQSGDQRTDSMARSTSAAERFFSRKPDAPERTRGAVGDRPWADWSPDATDPLARYGTINESESAQRPFVTELFSEAPVSADRKRFQEPLAQDLHNLLDLQRSFGNSFGGPRDPINLPWDSTRKPINPVIGMGVRPGGEIEGAEISADVLSGQARTIGSRVGTLSPIGPPILGASGLSTAPATAPSQPIMKPRPPTLDFPMRKF